MRIGGGQIAGVGLIQLIQKTGAGGVQLILLSGEGGQLLVRLSPDCVEGDDNGIGQRLAQADSNLSIGVSDGDRHDG